jgi:hypothetical protein
VKSKTFSFFCSPFLFFFSGESAYPVGKTQKSAQRIMPRTLRCELEWFKGE